jgi:hypothetical protein
VADDLDLIYYYFYYYYYDYYYYVIASPLLTVPYGGVRLKGLPCLAFNSIFYFHLKITLNPIIRHTFL